MFDWDDLRVFLSAARSGSLAAASSRLGIDPATVSRRIARLETALQATLIVRSPGGLRLTATGAQLLETGGAAEAAMEAAAHVAQPDRLSGTVRLSVAEGFGTAVLAPSLAEFHQAHPHLRIELAATTGLLSASRREVDMAVTLSAPEGSRVIAEPLAPYQLALYAAPAYLARRPAPAERHVLSEHDIVGYIADLIFAPELNYLDEVQPGLTPHLASSSIRAQREIIAGGGGIGVLPCFMAEGLTRVLDDVLLERQLWLSTHHEVHGVARMRSVRNWIRKVCEDGAGRMSPYA